MAGKGWRELQQTTRRAKSLLESARIAMDSRDFEGAKDCCQQSVQLFDLQNESFSRELLSSFQGLAEANFSLKNYAAAAENFQTCLNLLKQAAIADELSIAIMVKRARALENLEQIKDAENQFAQAFASSQQILGKDHVICVSTKEAYAKFLRKNHINDELASSLEEEAIASGANRNRPAALDTYNQQVLNSIQSTSELSASESHSALKQQNRGRFRLLKPGDLDSTQPQTISQKITRIFAIMSTIALASCLVIYLSVCWTINYQGDQKSQKLLEAQEADKLVGHAFRTADDILIIKFEKPHKALLHFYNVDKELDFFWRKTVSREPGQINFSQTSQPDQLVDEYGTKFYREDAPELLLVKKGMDIADALNRYLEVKQNYPKTLMDLKIFEPGILYRNPYPQNRQKVEDCAYQLEDNPTVFQQNLEQKQSEISTVPKSAIEVYVSNGISHSYVIKVRDRDGHYLKICNANLPLTITGEGANTRALTELTDAQKGTLQSRIDNYNWTKANPVIIFAATN